MNGYTEKETRETLHLISSTINSCEKMQPKFLEGTSQHTLLKNRIKALSLSKSLLTDKKLADKYTVEELVAALRPLSSIMSKCEKAKLKLTKGTSQYAHLKNLIQAMYLSKLVIANEISNRSK